MFKNKARYQILGLLILIGILLINVVDFFEKISLPIDRSKGNWDSNSYWQSPWGASDIHRGIDIFALSGSEVYSPSKGLVISSGYSKKGGNYIYIMSANLKIYYFAHLRKRLSQKMDFVNKMQLIGLVGDTGNAKFSPFHLHFSIFSCVPILRCYSLSTVKGWQKMFYLNPVVYFE